MKSLPISIRYVLYPGLLVIGSAFAYAGQDHMAPTLALALTLVISCAIIMAAERALPHREDWRAPRRVWLLDFFYTLVSSQFVARGTKLALAWLIGLAFHRTGAGLAIWPSEWHPALQLVLAVVVADFFIYWGHRIMHKTDVGWQIHLVHHSPTHMHMWAAARSHPFNVFIKVLAETTPLLLLGISFEIYTTWLAFMTINGLVQHANVDVDSGPLSQVLATAEAHRVHHSPDYEPSNFGNVTMIWDQVFRTFRDPKPVGEIGVGDLVPEETYLQHLATPFRRP